MRFLLRRVCQSVLTVVGVLTASFFLVHLTGDPVALLVPPEATDADIARLRAALGLDQPLLVQYAKIMVRAGQGDLGQSMHQNAPALVLVLERIPATLELALSAFALGLGLAFATGLLLQLSPRDGLGRRLGGVVLWLAFCRQAIPAFWFGLLLILL